MLFSNINLTKNYNKNLTVSKNEKQVYTLIMLKKRWKMEKQQVWFAISENTYEHMRSYAEKVGLPKVRSKFLLYVFHNFKGTELKTDYSYSHANRKMICAKLSHSEIEYISELEKKFARNSSSLARDMLYTFLLNKTDDKL